MKNGASGYKFRQMFPGQLGSSGQSFLWCASGPMLSGIKKRWKKAKKVFLAPADTRKLRGGHAGT